MSGNKMWVKIKLWFLFPVLKMSDQRLESLGKWQFLFLLLTTRNMMSESELRHSSLSATVRKLSAKFKHIYLDSSYISQFKSNKTRLSPLTPIITCWLKCIVLPPLNSWTSYSNVNILNSQCLYRVSLSRWWGFLTGPSKQWVTMISHWTIHMQWSVSSRRLCHSVTSLTTPGPGGWPMFSVQVAGSVWCGRDEWLSDEEKTATTHKMPLPWHLKII